MSDFIFSLIFNLLVVINSSLASTNLLINITYRAGVVNPIFENFENFADFFRRLSLIIGARTHIISAAFYSDFNDFCKIPDLPCRCSMLRRLLHKTRPEFQTAFSLPKTPIIPDVFHATSRSIEQHGTLNLFADKGLRQSVLCCVIKSPCGVK